jgi:hypothetical protein
MIGRASRSVTVFSENRAWEDSPGGIAPDAVIAVAAAVVFEYRPARMAGSLAPGSVPAAILGEGASRMNGRGWIGLPVLIVGLGCGVAPRHFRALTDPAPMTRARAAHLGDGLPETLAIPALIDRLDDPDPVVRLSAHEALRRRTGQQFGFVPWADPAERAQAVARWRSWWTGRQASLAQSRSIP